MINVSLYSCVMGLLWFNIGIVVILFLRRSNQFIKTNGIKILFFLSLGCIFRIICPIDLSFSKVIRSKNIYPWILDKINEPFILSRLSLFNLFVITFVFVGIFLFIYEIIKYNRFRRFIEKVGSTVSEEIVDIYDKVVGELNIKHPPKLIQSHNISTPYMTGFFKPLVLLPDWEFSEKELYYIFRHELIHYKNNDVWIKWFSVFMLSMLWWNPLTHFFKSDLTQILEIKCDTKACEHLDDMQKIEYTKTIVKLLKFGNDSDVHIKPHYYSSAMAKEPIGGTHIKQRFDVILHTSVLKRQRVSSFVAFVAMIIMWLMSYTFIIQPAYFPVIDDFPVGGVEMNIVFEDGVYKLYGEGKFVEIINEKELEWYKMRDIPFSR